jgi:ATP-binding cassette subfamily B protein
MAQQSQPTLSVLTLNRIFGETLSESHFQQCLSQIQSITPKVGKFWQSSTSKAGIYIIILGKVRLLDTDDELIATLGTGEFFGELTLFPEENFLPYDARASLNLKLCFLPYTVIFSLLNAYPSIRERLLQQAQTRNALLLKSEHLPSLESSQLEITNHWSVVAEEIQPGRKIQKAYFPTPTSRIGHWLQRIIRRYPFFAQQSASDCGAACLVMISRYWGKRFSVNRIRDIE